MLSPYLSGIDHENINSYSGKKMKLFCNIKYTFTIVLKNDGLDLHKNLPINVH